MAADDTHTPLLEARGIQKHFGRVVALRDANFALEPAEVHAVVGDNGAGKSTLIKILSGALPADGGEILLEGQPVHFDSPRAARAHGIETVYQDLALADHLDASANLFLGREVTRPASDGSGSSTRAPCAAGPRRRCAGYESASRRCETPVLALSGGQRQGIAVARAIAWGSRIVIMDEPTAALGVRESLMVLDLIRGIRDEGIGVIMISHNLPEVFAVASRITVLRLGRTITTMRTEDSSVEAIVSMMTGVAA